MAKMRQATGLAIDWGFKHRDGTGNLISRQVMIQPPLPITCIKPICLWRYQILTWKYLLMQLYHKYRVGYAERNRYKTIPEYYRTGDNMPFTIRGLLWEIFKLGVRR